MINYLRLPFDVLLSCGPIFEYVVLPLFLLCMPIFAINLIKYISGVIQ